MAENENEGTETGAQVAEQAQQQTGRQVRLRFDETKLTSTYANAFRTNTSAEEVIVDFGLNQMFAASQGQQQQNKNIAGEILFQVNSRVILNYYTAKRLAIQISQMVRAHEQQFGELKLDVGERQRGAKKG